MRLSISVEVRGDLVGSLVLGFTGQTAKGEYMDLGRPLS